MKKNQQGKYLKFIVSKFADNKCGFNWGVQMGVAKTLILAYPDISFWDKLTPPDKQIYSLTWFLTKEGKSYLANQYMLQGIKTEEPKNKFNFQKEKIGKDFKIKPKKSGVLDFFK